jgi:hypothetical protein
MVERCGSAHHQSRADRNHLLVSGIQSGAAKQPCLAKLAYAIFASERNGDTGIGSGAQQICTGCCGKINPGGLEAHPPTPVVHINQGG